MGAGWSFVTLDDEQKHTRRRLLDQYGFIAQLSVLAPLFVVQLYFLAAWATRRARQSSNLGIPSSPVLKSLQLGNQRIRDASASLRKAVWWCGDDVTFLGGSIGTKGEVLFTGIWTAWLLLLSFLEIGDDYLHLTKRMGIVAASQLPFHYLLAVKTPYSPLQLLSHASHETLNAIHQSLGRITTALMLAHAVLYLNFYIQSGILQVRLQEAYVICGLVSIILFALLNASSLAGVRRSSYRLFLAAHIIISVVVLPLLYFHVHHIRVYVYETIAVLLLNVVLRALATRSTARANIQIIEGIQLVDISIPIENRSEASRWTPGQHAYLSLASHPLKATFARNPFTLSSVPTTDHRLRFVARIQKGNTAALASAARLKSTLLLIEGPYGITTHPDRLLQYDRVLLIAGGIGATFIIPLYRQLLTDLSPSAGSYRRQKVSAVWVSKSIDETAWAIPQDPVEQSGFYERLRVFVTGPGNESLPRGITSNPYDQLSTGLADDGIELQERQELLSKQEEPTALQALPLYAGRPQLDRLVDQVFSGAVKDKVAVVVCGPQSLGAAGHTTMSSPAMGTLRPEHTVRGGFDVLTSDEAEQLWESSKSISDKELQQFFNISPYTLKNEWLPIIHEELRKSKTGRMNSDAWWEGKQTKAVQQLWTLPDGPITRIFMRIPDVRKVQRVSASIDFVENGETLPGCAHEQHLIVVLSKIVKNECARIKESPDLQNEDSADLFKPSYKVKPEPSRTGLSQKNDNPEPAAKQIRRSILFIIDRDNEEAWRKVVAANGNVTTVQKIARVKFDKMVDDNVLKTGEGDYNYNEILLSKLNNSLAAVAKIQDFELGYRQLDDSPFTIIRDQDDMAKAIIHMRGLQTFKHDHYMLVMGQNLNGDKA